MYDEQERSDEKLAPELAALESRLRNLTPLTPRIDRDRLMFAAGRAASLRPRWPVYIARPSWPGARFWAAATATMTAATILLATLLVWQRDSIRMAQNEPKPHPAIAHADLADSETENITAATYGGPPALRPATAGYLGIRYIALTRGANALPDDFHIAGATHDDKPTHKKLQPVDVRSMLNELLPPATEATDKRS